MQGKAVRDGTDSTTASPRAVHVMKGGMVVWRGRWRYRFRYRYRSTLSASREGLVRGEEKREDQRREGRDVRRGK